MEASLPQKPDVPEEELEADDTAIRFEAMMFEIGADRESNYDEAFDHWKILADKGDEFAYKRCQELVNNGLAKKRDFAPKVLKTSQYKILIIEDDDELRHQMRDALENKGFKTVTAINGVLGIDQIGKHPDISLVLVNLFMPKMNGIQFVQQIRTMKALEGIPIVVCSGFTNSENLVKLKKLKVAGVIMKPFDIFDLIKYVIERLNEKGAKL